VVVGDVLGANTFDVVMVEAVAEAAFVGVMGTVLTGRCIRSLLLGAGIALQLMKRPPVCSTAAHIPATSAPVGQCRIPCRQDTAVTTRSGSEGHRLTEEELFGLAAVRDSTAVWLDSVRFTAQQIILDAEIICFE
jgi:hypothetical protein